MSNKKWKVDQIFVAFSEYLSFKYIGVFFAFACQYVLEYKNCNILSPQSDWNLNDFVYKGFIHFWKNEGMIVFT